MSRTTIMSLLMGLAQAAADNGTDETFDYNPILSHQPQFARSLPVQILLTGIVFTLVAVLLIHLIFTAQYHWPLAPVNYILQISGVSTLLISLIATLHVVLSTALSDSQQWPYMLNYIAVTFPLKTWNTAEVASWLAMEATVSALVQITHIQFLTLLYPSHLEARLILFLLGPIAILSAAMEMVRINQTQKVVDMADVIRNTCNATLSLLFTTALFIWGFLVNRKQAWRTDGGTAAFGGGALTLALISTGLNFLYIPTHDQYVWLPGLMWAVVLWQSFLGWWWWVGGGMGVGEVEELLRREEKRERKRRARLARRTERKEKAQSFWRSTSESLGFAKPALKASDQVPSASIPPRPRVVRTTSEQSIPSVSGSVVGSASTSSGAHSANTGTFYHRLQHSIPGRFARKWFVALRHAHLTAAHVQAMERVERRQQAYGIETVVTADPMGWGLGSFGLREREKRKGTSDHEDEDELWGGGRAEDHGRDDYPPLQPAPDVASAPTEVPPPKATPVSVWWWEPLRRWRLQDSTVY